MLSIQKRKRTTRGGFISAYPISYCPSRFKDLSVYARKLWYNPYNASRPISKVKLLDV